MILDDKKFQTDMPNTPNKNEDNIKKLKLLLEKTTQVEQFINEQDENKQTALHYAVLHGFVDAVKILVA